VQRLQQVVPQGKQQHPAKEALGAVRLALAALQPRIVEQRTLHLPHGPRRGKVRQKVGQRQLRRDLGGKPR